MEQVEKCIDNIRNLTFDVATACVKSSVYDAIDAIYDDNQNTTYVFCIKAKNVQSEIHKVTDFVVGFVAYGDVEIVLHTTKLTLSRYKLKKGQFVYAIDYDYILPLLSTRFEMIRLWVIDGSPDDVGIVYGRSSNSDTRRFIACNMTKSGTVYFGRGMCYKEFNGDCDVYVMPNMRDIPSPKECLAMSKERSMVLLQEFAEVTWNPQRVRMWCLPFDDEFSMLPECSYKNEMRKLWLDDILVVDGVEVKYERNNNVLCSNIHELLRAQNMTLCGQVRFVEYASGEGMHEHKDYALEGGTHTFIAYIDNNTAGHVCFPHNGVRIIPRRNRIVVFDVELSHWVEPCCEPKRIITGECMYNK